MAELIELVVGLKKGDADAQRVFWQTFWPRTYPICARILGAGPDATDIAVDLLTDFMDRRVHDIDQPMAIKSYIRLMAVRQSLSVRKRRAQFSPLDYDVPDAASLDPEEQTAFHTLIPRLDRCLEQLNPRAKQTLRLKYDRQLSNERIGGLLGVSKQYIGRLIQKSLTALRMCLEKAPEKIAE